MTMEPDAELTTNPNTVINSFMKDYATFLEVQIKSKDSMLKLLRKELETNPGNLMAQQQINQGLSDMKELIRSLLDIRKDSDFLMPDTKTIISTEGFCVDCGKHDDTTDHDFNPSDNNY